MMLFIKLFFIFVTDVRIVYFMWIFKYCIPRRFIY